MEAGWSFPDEWQNVYAELDRMAAREAALAYG